VLTNAVALEYTRARVVSAQYWPTADLIVQVVLRAEACAVVSVRLRRVHLVLRAVRVGGVEKVSSRERRRP
jgi:hypothetical protein